MRTVVATAFVTAAAAVFLACPPTPPQPAPVPPDADAAPIFPEAGPLPPAPEAAPPPPAYDGSTTSACYRACQALQLAGCKEGSGNCITKLQVISDGKLEPNKANQNKALTCDDLAKVKTAADVVATGQPCTK